jgi:hypothetical protein|tara:strand:- start:3518 stop:3763 length:246 start_codon:yes stop_codon:yes gene_type:complete
MTLVRRSNGSSKVSFLSDSTTQNLTRLGLADVERAYVHVDYEDEHDIKEEHKPLYELTQNRSIKERVQGMKFLFKKQEQAT